MNKVMSAVLENNPITVFRMYTAAVLTQFAVLSFCSVQMVEPSDMAMDLSFWWGISSAFGACSLVFKSKFKSWRLGAFLSEGAAVATFVTLSYDYLTRKPPIIAGSVLSATAAAFLIGGLIYERRTV
jgi:predicted membrane channel-forming protein YqfA (hemolysin III family)